METRRILAAPGWLLLALVGCNGGPIELTDSDEVPSASESEGEEELVTAFSVELLEDHGNVPQVSWTLSAEATIQITYRFGEEDQEAQAPTVTLPAGEYQQVMLGIPYEADYTWQFIAEGSADTYQDSGGGTTEELPSGMPEPELIVADDSAYWSDGIYLLGSVNQKPGGWVDGQFWNFITDRQGRVVWSYEVPRGWSLYPQVSADGTHLLLDGSTFWSAYDEGESSVIRRMYLDGTVLERISTPGLHHPFLELADGSLVWGAASWSNETLEKRTPDGEQEQLWDCRDFIEEMESSDYCQSNSMFYVEETDSFLFSFYTLEEVVEIDHATGATLHAFGNMEGSWDFDPVWSTFKWQHGPSYTDEGNFLVSSKTPDGTETVVYEYELDEETETLSMVWSFGEGEGIYAATDGEARRLANGNTLHNYGSEGRVREITDDGDVVWDMDFMSTRLIGHTTFIEDLYTLVPPLTGEESR